MGLSTGESALPPKEIYEKVSKRGFHIIPGDSGGATMCGVTIGTFRDWRRKQGKPEPGTAELRQLGYEEWLAILRHFFWNPCRADEISNDSIAQMLVDWRWVNGTQAIRDAQNVLSMRQDGIVGPKTLAALNGADSRSIFLRLKGAREGSYRRIVSRDPKKGKFLKGWLNRTESIKFEK